jgi:hypothetical protein
MIENQMAPGSVVQHETILLQKTDDLAGLTAGIFVIEISLVLNY